MKLVKVKFCGISHVQDAITAEKLGADFIGVVADTVSPRYVKHEFVKILKNHVTKPVVIVKVNGTIQRILNEGKEADIIQIHRVLSEIEIEELLSSSIKNLILYVPASREFEGYFRLVISRTNYMILLDKNPQNRLDLSIAEKWLKEYYKTGIGGGITPQNVREYLYLDPYWIDISSGIETYKGKKDSSKMALILKEVREWKYTR
ncbi:phosphoribosylanthranilate isomerase [Stygiolobus caldivivus]|uniref:N-(5'-phosphoribosyl)anthranilate isomerase n=1 Tax=Stygiolobus caldivivus TaxID=2824673 RepID=A0A8D5ZKB3_9CREN|nr:N-(5'-phosphoribosyl)anthranilate isomerase [Stygiolobus caldivivus]BCU71205.1 N-(5'-phosphoribosyl)anthranilate isomerase [Stygiolobus caldivivus]